MRTRITRSFDFEAAHELPWHPGKCRRLHGHDHRFEVTVEGPLDERGVVVDFDDVKRVVQAEVIDHYDHRYLNDFSTTPRPSWWPTTCGSGWKRPGWPWCGCGCGRRPTRRSSSSPDVAP